MGKKEMMQYASFNKPKRNKCQKNGWITCENQ